MGGGGGTAITAYETYVKETHALFLYNNTAANPPANIGFPSLMVVMDDALNLGGNPFIRDQPGEEYTPPDSYFADGEAAKDVSLAFVNNLDPVTDFENFVSRAIQQSDILDRIKKATITLATPDSIGDAVDALSDGKAEASIPETHLPDWTAVWDAVQPKVAALSPFDLAEAIDDVVNYTADLIEQALIAATNAVANVDLTDLLAALRAEAEIQRAASVREFTSGMADINAVQGSAFVFGLGLLYSEADKAVLRQVAEYRAEIYRGALGNFSQLGGGVLQGLVQLALQNDNLKGQLIGGSVDSILRLLQGREGFEQQQLQIFGQMFQALLSVYGEAELQEANTRNQAVAGGIDQLARFRWMEGQMKSEAAKMATEVGRIQFVAQEEYEGAVVDLDAQAARWPFEVYERGSNVLAAPTGMAARVPERQSRASSAISGALSGAAMGSAVPGIGTVAGGLLGGMAGLLA